MVGDAVTEINTRQRQKSLIGLSLRDADALFGPLSDTFRDIETGDRYVRFNTSYVLGKQNFYMVHVSKRDRVLDVQQWIEWHDGFEDTAKLAWVKPKIVGKTVSEAEGSAKLKSLLFVFDQEGSTDQWRVYDATNWTHRRTRLLVLIVDESGICREVRYYGVAGAQSLKLSRR